MYPCPAAESTAAQGVVFGGALGPPQRRDPLECTLALAMGAAGGTHVRSYAWLCVRVRLAECAQRERGSHPHRSMAVSSGPPGEVRVPAYGHRPADHLVGLEHQLACKQPNLHGGLEHQL
eukprot:8606654-Pyramimonas_sp.AAC.3